MSVKEIKIPISTIQDGLNNADPPDLVGKRYMHSNGRKQVKDCIDIMLHNKKQRPGGKALFSDISGRLRGMGTFLQIDGTETKLCVAGGKLYSVGDSSLTELYDLTGDGEAYFQNILDICVVCNGAEVVKVEDESTAYKLGISAPTGATSELAMGGSLAVGVWNIYLTHTRKVDDVVVLRSTGQSVTSRTSGGGNQTITITFSDASSSDAQITHVEVWMSGPSDSGVYYYYGEAAIDDGSVSISSNTNKNTSLIYSVQALNNNEVPNFDYIAIFNNYLYGSVDNILYRSRQAGTRYQLERFDTSTNYASYPFTINGIFPFNDHIYLNTPGGMILVPYGELESQYQIIEGDYFKFPKTVKQYSGYLMGVTQRRFAIFDGQRFLPHDVASDVKPDLEKAINGASSTTPMGAEIYRRNDRLEYHLGYYDSIVGGGVNNRRLVLNLDTFQLMQDNEVRAAWEKWSSGFNYMIVTQDGDWYCGQSHSSISTIYYEDSQYNKDQNIYVAGSLVSENDYGWSFTVGSFIPDIEAIARITRVRMLAVYSKALKVNVSLDKWPPTSLSYSIEPYEDDVARYGTAIFGVSRYAPTGPQNKIKKLNRSLKAYSFDIKIFQTEEDKTFDLRELLIIGTLTKSRFT